jgi:hypothetical protein
VGQDCLDLRAEDQRPARGQGVVEGLDADPVAEEEELVSPLVPEGKGEHTPEAVQKGRRTPFLVGVDERLGVGLGGHGVAPGDELVADLGEVVGLSVVGDPDRAVLVGQGLVPGDQVDDAQAAVAQADPLVDVDALVVGAAVGDGPAHPDDQIFGDGRGPRRGAGQAADAAHVRASSG